MKTKIVLAVVALFVAVEVKAYRSRENHYERPGLINNPGRDLAWQHAPQQDYHQNNGYGSNVEWICQSPKTNAMMVITDDHNMRQNSGRGPWWQWQHLPPGHQRHDQNWRYVSQPIFIIRESTGINVGNDDSQSPLPSPTTPETHNNNNNNEPQTTPSNNGEGLIDIRIGAE